MPLVSLAALTILDAGPVGQVRAAHAAGFEAVGLRLQPLLATDTRVSGDPHQEAALRAAMAETGLKLLEVGVFPITPEMDVAGLAGVLSLAAEFSARFVVCPVEDAEPARRLATFRALCDLAATFGLDCLVEFNPYSACRSLAEARELALSSGRATAGLVIDLLHLSRSGGGGDDLRKVETHLLKLVHFCDASAMPEGARTIDELRAESRTARRLPGDGVLPLAELLRAFPAGTPISVEAPSAALAHLPAVERARRVLAATRSVLEAAL